jgi:formamidopyrimidine-DNA glycosylase
VGARLTEVRRRGKHLLLDFDNRVSLAVHLMRAGRLRLKSAQDFRAHRKRTLFYAAFEGDTILELTEAGTERRVRLHVLETGASPLEADRGIEPLSPEFTAAALGAALRAESHRLKNALRDPDIVAGFGNAYSDEILHAARLSPMRETRRMTDEEVARLHEAILGTLREWIEQVRKACPPGMLPEKQDLWRRHFVVHGKAGEPCPVCGTTIERISYVDSDTDYCPTCQNEGRILADRRLSRLGIRRPRLASPPAERAAAAPDRDVPPLAGDGVPCESPPSHGPTEDPWPTPTRPKRRKPPAKPKGRGSSKGARD